MSKIYQRESLILNAKPKEKVKKRKRNVIMNFRVTPEEQQMINCRIELTGMKRQDFFIDSCRNQKIKVLGNIRTFDEIKKKMKEIDQHLCGLEKVDEIKSDKLESLRTILQILDGVYGEDSSTL